MGLRNRVSKLEKAYKNVDSDHPSFRDMTTEELEHYIDDHPGPPLHVTLGYRSDREIPDEVLLAIIDGDESQRQGES